jgi:hypothetical protein
MDSVISVTKEIETTKRQIRFRGITQAVVIDREEGLFAALLEFAFHHTTHNYKFYNNAVINSFLQEQKTLFLQIICRKTEVINKLRIYRLEFSLGHSPEKAAFEQFGPEKHNRKNPIVPVTFEDSIALAFEKENRTLDLYNKMALTMRRDSTKALFNYLISTQMDCLGFLANQFPALSPDISKPGLS